MLINYKEKDMQEILELFANEPKIQSQIKALLLSNPEYLTLIEEICRDKLNTRSTDLKKSIILYLLSDQKKKGDFRFSSGSPHSVAGSPLRSQYSKNDNTFYSGLPHSGSSSPLGTNSNFSSQSSGCFIASAAYNSCTSKEVIILQQFRDKILLTNSSGRNFVLLYYKYSPKVALFINNNPFSKKLVRLILYPIIIFCKYIFRHDTNFK